MFPEFWPSAFLLAGYWIVFDHLPFSAARRNPLSANIASGIHDPQCDWGNGLFRLPGRHLNLAFWSLLKFPDRLEASETWYCIDGFGYAGWLLLLAAPLLLVPQSALLYEWYRVSERVYPLFMAELLHGPIFSKRPCCRGE